LAFWTESAIEDLNNIVDYIALDSIEQAIILEDTIYQKADNLDVMPMMGKSGRIDGTREFVALPNYIIIYQIRNNAPVIIRIKHAALKI
jgi:addiction module RelE/StbE family toxin